jgi:hypothetical protein
MTRLFQISYSQKKTKRLNESRIYTVKSKRRQLRLLRNNQNLQGKSDLIKKSAKCLKALNLLQYEAFVAHKTAPFRDKINVISDSMKKVLTASGAQSEDELPPGQNAVKYAQLAVNLADVELQRTRTEADAREYGLHHLTDFQQQPAQKEYIAKHNELEVLREDISKNKCQLLRCDAISTMRWWITERPLLLVWDILISCILASERLRPQRSATSPRTPRQSV